MAQQAITGDTVKVHYKGTFENGSTFDSSFNDDPIEFKIGKGTLLLAFEEAVVEMEEGSTTHVQIKSEDAYGPYLEEHLMDVPISEIPSNITPEVGMTLQGHTDDGKSHLYSIKAVNNQIVTVDGNHPLAGQNLKFEIKLIKII